MLPALLLLLAVVVDGCAGWPAFVWKRGCAPGHPESERSRNGRYQRKGWTLDVSVLSGRNFRRQEGERNAGRKEIKNEGRYVHRVFQA